MAVIEQETQVVEAPAVPVHPKLLEAAKLIRDRGWCQGYYHDIDGRLCLVGAIWRATHHEGTGPAWDALKKETGFTDGCLSYWNDRPGRTQEEVLELLERVGWGI